jgi:alpha-beta hydrolase superfamily lysophospholipase
VPEEVSFRTSDGVTVFADLHLTRGDKKAPLILLFHQAGGDARGEYGTIVPRLLKRGFHVLAVDQRVGGERFGGTNRTLAGIEGASYGYCDAYPDLEAALAFVQARGFTGKRVAWGSSYSAALVIRLAAEHADELSGVLAFSPASGEPLKDCLPEAYADSLEIPVLALRPASEMKRESVRVQLERFGKLGMKTYVADPGRHGSSMLVRERVEGDVEPTWSVVLHFLDDALGVERGKKPGGKPKGGR